MVTATVIFIEKDFDIEIKWEKREKGKNNNPGHAKVHARPPLYRQP